MLYYQVVLFSASILIAAIIGGIRFNKIDSAFYPVIICFWIASVNEIISFILSHKKFGTTLNNNVYVLVEAILLTVQFKNWGLFNNKKKAFYTIIVFFAAIWLLENYQGFAAQNLRFYFRIIYSFIIVLMSIHLNNSIIFTHHRNIIFSPIFQFCTGFIIFFTCKIVVEVAWLYGLHFSTKFLITVYVILSWINLFVNLLYTSATLCIPQKKKHFMLY